jgi:hypothetical protein
MVGHWKSVDFEIDRLQCSNIDDILFIRGTLALFNCVSAIAPGGVVEW